MHEEMERARNVADADDAMEQVRCSFSTPLSPPFKLILPSTAPLF